MESQTTKNKKGIDLFGHPLEPRLPKLVKVPYNCS